MKAFKKYQKEYQQKSLTSNLPSGEESWRAALEWFKNTMDEIEEHDMPITGEEVINRELEQ